MFEERKWNKAKSKVLVMGAENRVKKNKRKMKLDQLYKRCMSLFLAMNFNTDLCNMSMGYNSISVSEQLNSHIKEITNLNYFQEQFNHWKKSISQIEEKISKKFGEKKFKKAENLLKVIELMKRMISTQESNFKNLKDNNLENSDVEMNIEIFPNKNKEIVDIDVIGREFDNLIQEIMIEIDSDVNMFLENSQNVNLNENDLITKLYPRQLFYNNNFGDNFEEIKSYLEKNYNVEKENINILCNYDYKKILNSFVDVNKQVDEGTSIFNKIFPPIFFIDKDYVGKELLENEIEVYKSKNDKFTKESVQNKIFHLKFERLTNLQKLVFLWGLQTFGCNYHILSEIGNIFYFTKSLQYEPEEIYLMIDKLLIDLNIDLIASGIDSLPGSNSFYKLIYTIDSPMLNSNHCNFFYNENVYAYLLGESVLNKLPDYNNKQSFEGENGEDAKIYLIKDSLLFSDKKHHMTVCLKEDLKKVCMRVEKNFDNFMKNIESIDFQTMTRKKDTSKSGTKKNTIGDNRFLLGKVQKFPKENLNIDFSKINNISSISLSNNILDKTRPFNKQETLEGVSFFSQQSIQKEWENLRSMWYQNNTQFKPKFRKPRIYFFFI